MHLCQLFHSVFGKMLGLVLVLMIGGLLCLICDAKLLLLLELLTGWNVLRSALDAVLTDREDLIIDM